MKVFFFKLILKLSGFFTLKQNRVFARVIGKLIWRFSKKNKRNTIVNIEKCFPDLSSTKQDDLAKKTINATIMNMLELGTLWNKNTQCKDVVKNIYGADEFDKALKQNKGLLLALPHMGNWEVMNLVLSQFDKYAFLYKQPDDPNIEKILVQGRSKSNALQIEANLKGVRKIILHLKDQGFVTILPDQRPKSGQGVFVPFYNIPTYTMTLFSKLAIKTKVPVFFSYALRTEKGFDVYFEKSEEAIYSKVDESVAYMNAKIQQIVDKAPEQYQWTYKRFSIQPEGEPPFY